VKEFNNNCLDADRENRLIPNSGALKWLKENIPLIDIPDKVVERAYYFRWWSFRKHIRKTSDGYIITEFMADVPWAGKHNTISCAAGHHFYEGRWIKNTSYIDQYLSFWFDGGGSIRSYSFWVADAAYRCYQVTGNIEPLKRHFQDFINNYSAWESSNGDENSLFWQNDDREGMELSMAGVGLRPNINSYMYADAKAIAAISVLLGDKENAQLFEKKAADIRFSMRNVLWDNDMNFFKTFISEKHRQTQHQIYAGANDNAYLDQPLGLCPVPELFGYAPWYYGVMDDKPEGDYLEAWKYIVDPEYFAGPAGLATAPIKHPLFMQHHRHECAWDGPSWPFATCQALGAMARTLRNYSDIDKLPVSARDFMNLITQYASAHKLVTDEGALIDWIDEDYDPIKGNWIARDRLYEIDDLNKDRGQYYNHSSFCDLIISDVIGLQSNDDGKITIHPLAVDWPYFYIENVWIHGRNVSVVYDRDGSRYNRGAGLMVYVDGKLVGQSDKPGKIECSI